MRAAGAALAVALLLHAPASACAAGRAALARARGARTRALATPEAVADAFAVTVEASPVDGAVDAHALGWSYSTGEIIAIVLGFILGISGSSPGSSC
jgi:hypothetical protein